MSVQGRRAALQNSLNMMREDWMRDHLIGNSPTTDAAIMSSPLQQLHSVAFETALKFDPLDSTTTDCNGIASSDTVLVPGYSKDGVSAGYFIAETYGVFSDHLLTAHNGMCSVRFLSEDESGTYITLARQSRADILMYLSHQLRKSTFYTFAFPKDTFSSLVNNGVTDINVYEAVIQNVFCSENLKQCSNCGKLPGEPCTCVFTFMRAKSPLDLFAIKHNIVETHIGRAFGKGVYEIFENGVSKQLIPVDAQHQIFHIPKSGTSKRLLNWAIGNALGSTSMQLPHAIGSSFTSLLPMNNTFDPVSEQFMSPKPPGTLISETNFGSDPSQLNCLDLSTNSTVSTPNANGCTSIISSSPTFADPGWPWNTTLQLNAATVSGQNSNKDPNHIFDGMQSFLPITPVVARAQLPNSVPVNVPPIASDLPNQAPEYRPVRIAPRSSKNLTTCRPEDSDFDNDKMKKSAEEVRAWRLYQRKIRNRESAARSNQARREREIARRKDLAKGSR